MVTTKSASRKLSVLMNGKLVGQLEKSSTGALSFFYHDTWLATPGARPISLSLPLINQIYVGDSVHHFFDNLLPDNSQIRARIQTKFHAPSNQAFDLLAIIGKDCVGAIQLIEGEIPPFQKTIKATPLSSKEISTILRGYIEYPLAMIDETTDFRISIAGAQEKSAFLYHNKKWCRPLHDTPTSHIFKLPIGFIHHQQLDLSDSCENEWLCSIIAKAFGLPVASSEVMLFDNTKVLVVERFDRQISKDGTWLMRLPQEDMCQAMGISSHLKYQADGGPGIKDIMHLLLGSAKPSEDRDMFFRAQILFWLLAAVDGHAKNFSIFIMPEGRYQLAPLYDIISAYPMMANKQLQPQNIKMAMGLKSTTNHYHWQHVQRRHFLSAARFANYSPEIAESILDNMLDQVEHAIALTTSQLPANFPKKISEPIFQGMVMMKKRLSR